MVPQRRAVLYSEITLFTEVTWFCTLLESQEKPIAGLTTPVVLNSSSCSHRSASLPSHTGVMRWLGQDQSTEE